MSTQPLTYERFLEEMAESRREFDKRMEESRREFREEMKESRREFDKRMEKLTSRVGEIVEHMIGGDNIITQFQALGYDVNDHYRNRKFGIKNTKSSGQIDMILEDGDVEILIEVKTTLRNDDVFDHIERLEKYRRWMDSKGQGKKRYIGALACAVTAENVIQFAQKKGMFVILQLGNTVEIVAPPEGFKAKEW